MRRHPVSPSSPYQETCRLLIASGIDPSEVSVGSFGFFGYWTFLYDVNGRKLVSGNEFKKSFNQWNLPEAKVKEIVEAFVRESK